METLNQARLQLIYDAYHGAGGFASGSHLIQFGREQDDDFAVRKTYAFYDNQLRPACARYAGYLARNPALRETSDPILSSMLDDVDRAGTSAGSWWLSAAQEMKPYGMGIIVVDLPDAIIDGSQEDQRNKRLFPYFTKIELKDVVNYSIDDAGRFEMLEIDRQEFIGLKLVHRSRYWDTEKWWVKDHTDNIIAEGESPGVCPCVPFTESQFGYEGEFSTVGPISKRLYNLHNELDHLLREQGFGLLHYQVPPEQANLITDTELKETVGTKNMIKYFGDNPPGYSTPNSEPVDGLNKRIESLERRIKEITHTIEQGSSVPESGVAKEIRFQDLNSSLSQYAMRMEAAERAAWDIACLWLGKSPEIITVQWPRDFSIVDVDTELLVLTGMQGALMPPAAIFEQKRKIIGSQFPELEPETEAEILNQMREPEQIGVAPTLLAPAKKEPDGDQA